MIMLSERHAAGPRHGASRCGFSLVELLVVVVILAVLIAILVPVISSMRKHSRQVGCISNLRALGQAILLYSQSYDGALPNGNRPGKWDGDKPSAGPPMVTLAGEFVRDAASSVVRPTPNPPRRRSSAPSTSSPIRRGRVMSSTACGGTRGTGRSFRRCRAHYGSAPLAMDLGGGDAGDAKRNHKGGGNVVFADGHADWQDAKKWDGEDMPDPADEFWPKGPDGNPL